MRIPIRLSRTSLWILAIMVCLLGIYGGLYAYLRTQVDALTRLRDDNAWSEVRPDIARRVRALAPWYPDYGEYSVAILCEGMHLGRSPRALADIERFSATFCAHSRRIAPDDAAKAIYGLMAVDTLARLPAIIPMCQCVFSGALDLQPDESATAVQAAVYDDLVALVRVNSYGVQLPGRRADVLGWFHDAETLCDHSWKQMSVHFYFEHARYLLQLGEQDEAYRVLLAGREHLGQDAGRDGSLMNELGIQTNRRALVSRSPADWQMAIDCFTKAVAYKHRSRDVVPEAYARRLLLDARTDYLAQQRNIDGLRRMVPAYQEEITAWGPLQELMGTNRRLLADMYLRIAVILDVTGDRLTVVTAYATAKIETDRLYGAGSPSSRNVQRLMDDVQRRLGMPAPLAPTSVPATGPNTTTTAPAPPPTPRLQVEMSTPQPPPPPPPAEQPAGVVY